MGGSDVLARTQREHKPHRNMLKHCTLSKLKASVLHKRPIRKGKGKSQTKIKTKDLYPKYIKNSYHSIRQPHSPPKKKQQKNKTFFTDQMINIHIKKCSTHHSSTETCRWRAQQGGARWRPAIRQDGGVLGAPHTSPCEMGQWLRKLLDCFLHRERCARHMAQRPAPRHSRKVNARAHTNGTCTAALLGTAPNWKPPDGHRLVSGWTKLRRIYTPEHLSALKSNVRLPGATTCMHFKTLFWAKELRHKRLRATWFHLDELLQWPKRI